MKTLTTICLMIIAISASSQDTTKVKKDSIQYVPVPYVEAIDTIAIVFETLAAGKNNFMPGYLLSKYYKTLDGKMGSNPVPYMIVTIDYKPYRGRVYRVYETSYDLNPLNQKKDTSESKKPKK